MNQDQAMDVAEGFGAMTDLQSISQMFTVAHNLLCRITTDITLVVICPTDEEKEVSVLLSCYRLSKHKDSGAWDVLFSENLTDFLIRYESVSRDSLRALAQVLRPTSSNFESELEIIETWLRRLSSSSWQIDVRAREPWGFVWSITL